MNTARKGNVVVDSRYFYEDVPGLRIFMQAGLDTRIERALALPEYANSSPGQAREEILAREQDELRNGLALYGYDYSDPKHWNLVIDSGKFSVDQELDMILTGLG
jgi:cytidylate kinase